MAWRDANNLTGDWPESIIRNQENKPRLFQIKVIYWLTVIMIKTDRIFC